MIAVARMVTVASNKTQGAFHTPPDLAEWVAREVLAYASAAGRKIRSVLDPACGDGALLRAMGQLTDAPITLTGIDIDPAAAARCSTILGQKARVHVGDALHPDCEWADGAPDAVILNPPWGGELSQVRHFYQQHGYTLATGQFDTADLFVERALTVLEPGALLGLILPETVFVPRNVTEACRQLLLEHTLLAWSRRLGDLRCFDGRLLWALAVGIRGSDGEAGKQARGRSPRGATSPSITGLRSENSLGPMADDAPFHEIKHQPTPTRSSTGPLCRQPMLRSNFDVAREEARS